MNRCLIKPLLHQLFAAPTVDETILFVGPHNDLPTRIRLRVFEFPSGADVRDCQDKSDYSRSSRFVLHKGSTWPVLQSLTMGEERTYRLR